MLQSNSPIKKWLRRRKEPASLDMGILSVEDKTEETLLKKIESIESKLNRIQKSTAVTFPVFSKVHNVLRQKYRWYYNWHLWPYFKFAQAIIFSVCITGIFGFESLFFSSPRPVEAASATYTYASPIVVQNPAEATSAAAYYGNESMRPTAISTEVSSVNYTSMKIRDDADSYVYTLADKPYIMYRFYVNPSIDTSNITQIAMTHYGFSDNSRSIFVWNILSSAWEGLGSDSQKETPNDFIGTKTITSATVNQFINSSTRYYYFLVGCPDVNNTLTTDYISSTVTYDTSIDDGTCVWDGGGNDNNWSTAENWTNDAIPTSICDVIFDSTSNKASVIDANFTNQIKSLSLDSGYDNTLSANTDLNNNGDITLVAGTFAPGSQTINVGGNWINTGTNFIKGTSTINFNSSTPGATINTNNQDFYNMIIASTSSISTPNIWIPNAGDATFSKVNTSDGTNTAYPAVAFPFAIAVDADDYIWITDPENNTVSKFNGATGAKVGDYTTGNGPYAVAVDGNGYVWVANTFDNTVGKFDGSTGAKVGDYTTGNGPYAVAVDGNGYVWVANQGDNTVSKINSSTGAKVGDYATGSYPSGVAVDGNGYVWAVNQLDSTVSKINSSTGAKVGDYTTGNGPYAVAVDGNGYVWVANQGDNTVSKIDGSTGAKVGDYATGNYPCGVAVDSNGYVWVANLDDNTVSKIDGSTGAKVGDYATGGANPFGIGDMTGFALQKFVLGGSRGAYTLSSDITTTNSLTISSGSLTSGAHTITTKDFIQSGGTFTTPTQANSLNVSGDFEHSAGIFSAPEDSIVNLTGAESTTQIISGNTTFENLTAVASKSRSIQFASYSNQTINKKLTIIGAPNQLINLSQKFDESGTWYITPNTWEIDYIYVSNSTNQSETKIDPTNSIDGGGNSNWFITLPGTPGPVSIDPTSDNEFLVNWTDKYTNENGFKVFIANGVSNCSEAAYSDLPDYYTDPDETSQIVSYKQMNTQYCIKVIASNDIEDSAPAFSSPTYTLAIQPNTPYLGTITSDSIHIKLNCNYDLPSLPDNIESIQYLIKVNHGSDISYLSSDGTLSSEPVSGTFADFGGNQGITNTGLIADLTYTYSVASLNNDLRPSSYSSTISGTPRNYFIISAEADLNGNINPKGSILVRGYDDLTFNFSSQDGYHISKVIIDNVEEPTRISSYTFSEVKANHSIRIVTIPDNTCYWTGKGPDENWSTDSNWESNILPGPNCNAVFDSSTSKESHLDPNFKNSIRLLTLDTGYTGSLFIDNDITIADGVILRSGTLSPGSSTINLSGSWINSGATFIKGTSTVNFNNNNSGGFIKTNNQDFYNVNFSGTAGDISTPNIWAPNTTGISKNDALNGIHLEDFATGRPYGIAISEDNYIWATNDNNVYKINATTGEKIGSYNTGEDARNVAIDSNGYVWVTSYTSKTISKINPSNGNKIGDYTSGTSSTYPMGIAADPNGYVWITNMMSNTVSKLDASSGAKVADYIADGSYGGIAVDAENHVWISSNGNVVKLNSLTGEIIGTYPVNRTGSISSCKGIAIDADGNVWIANSRNGIVSKIKGSTGEIIGEYPTGDKPYGVSIDGYGAVWVTDYAAGTISRLDTKTGQSLSEITIGGHPEAFGDMTGFALQRFVLGKSAPTTYSAESDITVSNNLSINSGQFYSKGNKIASKNFIQTNGTFQAPSASGLFTISGNLTRTGGNFTAPKSSTVRLNGNSTQIISGNTTFENLIIDTTTFGQNTVKFQAGSNQTINSSILLQGSTDKLLTLGLENGYSNSDFWTLTLPSNYSAGDYISVSNSAVNSPNKILPNTNGHTTNEGNNPGWLFPSKPNLPSSLGPSQLTDSSFTKNNIPKFSFSINSENLTDKLKYQIQIDNNNDFSSPIIDFVSGLAEQGEKFFSTGQPEGSGKYISGDKIQKLEDGSYFWRVRATDSYGTSSDWGKPGVYEKSDFKIDTTIPISDIYLNPVNPDGSNGFYKASPVEIAFTISDGEGINDSNLYYKWDYDLNYKIYTGNSFACPEGIHTISYYGSDSLGNSNINSPFVREIKTDTKPPILQATAFSKNNSGSNNYFFGDVPTIMITGSDSTSGVSNIYYRWNIGDTENDSWSNTQYSRYTEPLIAPFGTNTLNFFGIDKAGNSNELSYYSNTYTVKNVTPDIELTSQPFAPNGNNNYFRNDSPSITLAISKSRPDLKSIMYKWDEAEYSVYNESLKAPEGTHTLFYYGIDNLGNISDTESQLFKIDTVSPTTKLLITPDKPDSPKDIYKESPLIEIIATDSNSGVSDVYYKWNEAEEYLLYAKPIQAPTGSNSIYFYASDKAGNTNPPESEELKVEESTALVAKELKDNYFDFITTPLMNTINAFSKKSISAISNSNIVIAKALNIKEESVPTIFSAVATSTTVISSVGAPIAASPDSLLSIHEYIKLAFFSFGSLITKKRKRFGKIIQETNNAPVAQVKINLLKKDSFYENSNPIYRLVESTYSDKHGAYAFIAEPGDYIIEIEKEDYIMVPDVFGAYKPKSILTIQGTKKDLIAPFIVLKKMSLCRNVKNNQNRLVILEKLFVYASSFFVLLGTLTIISALIKNHADPKNISISLIYPMLWYMILNNLSKRKVYGRIIDSINKKGVASVLIRVMNKNNKLVKTVVTNDRGEYKLLINRGEYTFLIIKDGYEQNNLPFSTKDKMLAVNRSIEITKKIIT